MHKHSYFAHHMFNVSFGIPAKFNSTLNDQDTSIL